MLSTITFLMIFFAVFDPVKRLRRYGHLTVFPKWRPSAILDLLDRVFGQPAMNKYLVVSIIMQNLVEIDEVVSIVRNFQYFSRLA